MNLTTYTLAVVLALALGGCRGITAPQPDPAPPTTPQPAPAPSAARYGGEPDEPGSLYAVRVELDGGVVRFQVDAQRMRGCLWQIFLNTDNNTRTGYTGYGYEFLANGAEAQGPRAPVQRTTPPWGIDPFGGWGETTGWGEFSTHAASLEVKIPVSALDGASAFGWAVFIESPDGRMLDYTYGQFAPPVLAVAR